MDIIGSIKRNRKSEVVNTISNYVDELLNENEQLRKRLQEYNKDSEIQKHIEQNKQLMLYSVHVMSESEKTAKEKFAKTHFDQCKSNYELILEGTGIGTAISVRCKKCNTTQDITDINSW